MLLGISLGPVFWTYGSFTLINSSQDMDQTGLELKGQGQCLKESLSKPPKTNAKYFIFSTQNFNNNMDSTRMPLKFMIEW